ncbi:hrp65 protein-like [Anoplolepis gracilipes]|uniref:hrp65 protein-like n=1 Tax=Anoplolepis gracilipes TaxID=354296 RepID=UPI003BA0CC1F
MDIMIHITADRPTSTFQPEPQVKNKKNSLSKVYIGNLRQDMTEEEIRILLRKYGEVMKCELHLEKACAIVEMDCTANAKKAKRELHGRWYKDRQLEIHLDVQAIRFEKLSSWIPNEPLEKAFGISTGKIERTIVFLDAKNSSIGEGIINFQTEKNAQLVLKCSRKCHILMNDLQPVNVESVEQNNVNDLLTIRNKNLPRNAPKFCTVRKIRSYSCVRLHIKCKYNKQWKMLYEEYERKREELERELMMEKEKLEVQLEYELEKIFLSKQKYAIAFHKQMIMKELQNKERRLF